MYIIQFWAKSEVSCKFKLSLKGRVLTVGGTEFGGIDFKYTAHTKRRYSDTARTTTVEKSCDNRIYSIKRRGFY